MKAVTDRINSHHLIRVIGGGVIVSEGAVIITVIVMEI